MEKVAVEMVEMAQETMAAKKEVANVEGQLRQQRKQLNEIQEMLKELGKTNDNNKSGKGKVEN